MARKLTSAMTRTTNNSGGSTEPKMLKKAIKKAPTSGTSSKKMLKKATPISGTAKKSATTKATSTQKKLY